MAAFKFATKNHNMIEFDYCGEGLFNVMVNGEEEEGSLYSRNIFFSSNFTKKRLQYIYLLLLQK